jgi:[phosphatase 2A protein]-leucine-carboxy methyltransferase
MLSGVAQGGAALHSKKYHLLPADLQLPPSQILEPALSSPIDPAQGSILDPSLPTLLLFECVLAYISPSASSQLLDWFLKFIQKSPTGVLGCVVYEMFGLNDSFGRVMVDNLRVCPSLRVFSACDNHYLAKEHLNTRSRTLSR